jgi:hypothetical protein
MLYILIDTCVWLDIAKNPDQRKILGVIDELINSKDLTLLLPKTIISEFDSNKEKIIRESSKSLSGVIKRVKQAVSTLGEKTSRKNVIDHLNDVDYKIPYLQYAINDSIDIIENLFRKAIVVDLNEQIKLRAAQRAIEKKAPFHSGKNSMNDAILIETYGDLLNKRNKKKINFAFVTHNKSDFSKPNGNENDPHPDFEKFFNKPWSKYSINLTKTIQSIDLELVTELMIEQEELEQEPRKLSEILIAEKELFDKIWYDRHQSWLYKILNGEQKIVERKTGQKYIPNETPREVFDLARKAAKKVERKYGKRNLGPWNDFEWGMINGKLSALRWILGDEWDNLDT